MKKTINLSPEALELVNQLCSPSLLEEHVSNLEIAEDTLQDIAYEMSDNDKSCEMFAVAYNIKSIRKQLFKLKTLLEDGREE